MHYGIAFTTADGVDIHITTNPSPSPTLCSNFNAKLSRLPLSDEREMRALQDAMKFWDKDVGKSRDPNSPLTENSATCRSSSSITTFFLTDWLTDCSTQIAVDTQQLSHTITVIKITYYTGVRA
jgi:hypothetical protein